MTGRMMPEPMIITLIRNCRRIVVDGSGREDSIGQKNRASPSTIRRILRIERGLFSGFHFKSVPS
jgi:hypothetical protein